MKRFGNHIGHIWGSSQRASMGEYTELERGRSKNSFLLYDKNRGKIKMKQNVKIQKLYSVYFAGIWLNWVNFRLTKIISNRLVRDELGE